MNKEQLFESMNGIDDEILEKSEKPGTGKVRRRLLWPMAACLCIMLIVAAVLLSARLKPQDRVDGGETNPTEDRIGEFVDWEVQYSEAGLVFRAPRYTPYVYSLSEKELQEFLPEKATNWMNFEGATAYFFADKSCVCVQFTIRVTNENFGIEVCLGDHNCSITPMPPLLSRYGNVEYAVCEYKHEFDDPAFGDADVLLIAAEAEINGTLICVSTSTDAANEERVKRYFETVLACFASYEQGKPDISGLRADADPDWYPIKSLEEARADEKYGKYLLDFSAENIQLQGIYWHRSKDFSTGLQSVWLLDEGADLGLICWDIVEYGGNADLCAEELTLEAVEARAYYQNLVNVQDMQETQIVRMEFSVKYGDMCIYVNSTGVDPQVIYEQLMAVRENVKGNG